MPQQPVLTAARPEDEARGLTSAEAARRLEEYGPNEVPERRRPFWRQLARRFWGPLPWMLEGTIVLTLALGKDLEAAIITTLLVLNSVIGLLQQLRSDTALELLRRRLAVHARVRRDGAWRLVEARELVPGDLVRVRVGDVVGADLDVLDGHVSVDQSSLTGESVPIDAGPGDRALGAATVTRGEATGRVVATGASSMFGKTSLLVREAKPATHLESVIFRIVRYLVIIDVALVAVMFSYAAIVGTSLSETAPFALIILIASVPVALPTTFTVAQAIGALELSRGSGGHGVLVTRLSAVQEAASMDVLCTDKTGTLTANELSLEQVHAYPPSGDAELIGLAALASDEAGQDPIDLALLRAADGAADGARRRSFVPFDPSTKRTEATVERDGTLLRVVKGMPPVVASLCATPPSTLDGDVERLGATGARVLAVAVGPAEHLTLRGLVALADHPRADSGRLVDELAALGIDVKMVTGDTAATARSVAAQVGIDPVVCTGEELRDNPALASTCSVFAAVFPEDKYTIVTSLQADGRIVGMTGDGVNDAPALKAAEVGIAVDSAVDVAKSAASMVLTEPGLVDTVTAVSVSRRIYQRMMTWTLNKIIKTAQVAFFLTLGFVFTQTFVTTPLLIVLLLLANDFVTMSLAVDRVRASSQPARWQVGALVGAALSLAAVVLVESFLDLWLARGVFHLGLAQAQTLIFLMLVFSGQATVYVVRERDRFWRSRPAPWLLAATTFDVIVVTLLAWRGVLMTSLALPYVALVLGIAVAFMFLMDPVKVAVLRRFRLV
ncbi:MAG TPA: plasma-membrane proton-efflux P-type ATPase [Acidimicrobiia bacterium]